MIKMYLENFKHECAIEDEKLNFLSGAYAHGKLEKGFYDYLNEDKKEHFDKRCNINGKECIAVLPNGKEVKALFFYWKVVHVNVNKSICGTYRTVWIEPRGLLVSKTDKVSIKYAQKCFNERQKHL